MQLFEFLEKYTNKDYGEYYINYNKHHSCYINEQNYPNNYPEKVINYYINKDIYNEDDEELYLQDVEEFKKHVPNFNCVYELTWYNNNPVGSYSIYGSTLQEIEEQVKELIVKEGLYAN